MVPRVAPGTRHPASRVLAARDPQNDLVPCLSTAPDSHARMAEGMRRDPLSSRPHKPVVRAATFPLQLSQRR